MKPQCYPVLNLILTFAPIVQVPEKNHLIVQNHLISFLQIQKKDIDFGRLIELAAALDVVLDATLVAPLVALVPLAPLVIVLVVLVVVPLVALIIVLVININHMNPMLIDHADKVFTKCIFFLLMINNIVKILIEKLKLFFYKVL